MTALKLKKSMRQHALQRAAQRYGITLNSEEYHKIQRRVRDNDVLARQKITCSRSLVLIGYQGIEILLIWSNTQQEIVTFLPPTDHKREELDNLRRKP